MKTDGRYGNVIQEATVFGWLTNNIGKIVAVVLAVLVFGVAVAWAMASYSVSGPSSGRVHGIPGRPPATTTRTR
jgi:hypothetical protein